ncbi:MAG: RDD family protein [Betaproteobacteria bacterium]|nr:MAG: RDD family protein [Betaproteobacteria bacterium]TMH27300.1 MAG: RDD family protein [Betaproteobacteria bacterium]
MSSVPDGNRFAPPTAHVADMVSADSVELGGRGARLVAAFLDGLLIGALAWGLMLATPMWKMMTTGHISMVTAFLMQTVGGLVLFTAVQGFFLATRGQTIGKMLLGLRIVRSDGERASLGRLIGLRYAIGSVIGVIPFIGVFYVLVDCLLIFRESHQCLHDNIADTIVVKA